VNIMMLLEMASGAMGDRVAIGDRVTGLRYEDLYRQAGQLAVWLRAEPAERVLFTDVASPILPVALFASSWAGKPFVPVSYRLTDDRLQALIARQAPAVVLHTPGTDGRLGQHGGVELVSTSDLAERMADAPPDEGDWSYEGDDIAILLHTSGTSGDPKVAVLRQRNLVAYVIGSVEFMGSDEHEATLVSVPPYHIAGMAALLTAMYSGRRVVQLANFEAGEWVTVAREQQITHAMVVPTMLARILDVLGEDSQGLPNLRHLSYGGGRMPLPVIEQAMALLPQVDFVNAYGLTETSSSIAVLGPQDHRDALAATSEPVRARLASVGRPLPTVEIEIRDEAGQPVSAGTPGEIYVRGDQVSGEYTSKAGTDGAGWFATNDGGWFDDDGFLFVSGRMDDVIVRGGENLSPGEIEDVILGHPAIRECAVVGVPDTQWGETVAAVVVVHDGAAVTAEELQRFVNQQLRSARTPTIVEFRPELPYNDTGKVLRRALRAQLAEQLG
jgi:acyl-CoA synthetase (AMP-forming)/AMP-acid ligase II